LTDIYDEGSLYAEEKARTLRKGPYKDKTVWPGDKPAKPVPAKTEEKR